MAASYSISQKDLRRVNNFIDGKYSKYFFKNFLDITDGNVEDAITLYKFDQRLRTVLLKYILKFELILKNDLVILAENAGASHTFWKDSSHYLTAATTISSGHSMSKFDIHLSKVQADIAYRTFSYNPTQNVNVFYAMGTATLLFTQS